MAERVTLNRFPLFGLFAYRAALRMGYPESAARLLGYSTALLYAIFKNKAQSLKSSVERDVGKKVAPDVRKELERATGRTVLFGGKQFAAVFDRKKQLAKTIVGHEVQTPEKYETQVRDKFPPGWHDRLARAFDLYLAQYDPAAVNEGNTLFELYRRWRDACKVGFNRVDLNQLLAWLDEHSGGGSSS